MSFEDAITYAVSALPPGELKIRFAEQVFAYLEKDRFQLKYKWKSNIPNSRDEVVGNIFRSIQMVIEAYAPSMKRLGVYFHGRAFYLEEFLEQAVYLLRIQDAVYSNYGENLVLKAESPSKILLKRYIRLFRNIFWLREYRTLRAVGINRDFHEMLRAENENALRQELTKRFGPDISIQWYLSHLHNIQNAGTLALAAILIPQISGAYFHQDALEKLETTKTEELNIQRAESLLNQSDTELKYLITEVTRNSKGKFNEVELEFLREASKALNKEQ